MTIRELNRDQLTEVKQNLLCEILDEQESRCPSYGEFAEVDEIISDDEVFAAYEGTEFSEGDFWCNCE